MIKNAIFILVLSLTLCACRSQRPDITGIDGTEIPAAFANFPDVPFPSESYIDLEETKALGSGEMWIGSLVFTTPYNSGRVFDFYVAEMPKYKWSELAIVRAKLSQMTYYRNNRALQILIEKLGENKSRVTITAIPNQNTDSLSQN